MFVIHREWNDENLPFFYPQLSYLKLKFQECSLFCDSLYYFTDRISKPAEEMYKKQSLSLEIIKIHSIV